MDIQFDKIEICPVCASRTLRPVMRGKDNDDLVLKYTILKCAECGVCVTDPQPRPEDIWRLYDERSSADFAPSLKGITLLRQYFFKRYIDKILKNIPGDGLTVLDYGCGDGLLSLLLSNHPRCRHVTAVDFHSQAPHYITREDESVVYLPHPVFEESTGRFDLILCRQVLEHVPDPVACLKRLRAHLNSAAWILVEVPDFQSIWQSIFRSNWSMLYLPRHLLHFTRASLSAVLERSGFSVRKLKRSHFPGMQTSLYHVFGKRSPGPGPLAVLLFPLQVALDMICRRATVIAAYAQRSAVKD